MSYVALATDRFEAMDHFYRELVGFAEIAAWDRPNARGKRLTLRGLQVELLDNARQAAPLQLGDGHGRFHLVIETDDLVTDRAAVRADASAIRQTSWGCRLFDLYDPDGVRVTFLQWDRTRTS